MDDVVKKPLRTGLRFNIAVYMGTLMLTAVILTSLVLFKITVTNLTQLEIRRGQDSLQSLQMSLGLLFEEGKPFNPQYIGFVQAMVYQLSHQLNVERLIVVDADGRTLASNFHSEPNKGVDPDIGLAMRSRDPVIKLVQSGTGLLSSGIREMSIAVPITRGRRVLGGIKATFSVAELDNNIRMTQRILFTFVAASIVLIMAFGVYYLSRMVINPINKLVKVTGRFAEGDLDARIEMKEENEMAYLAGAFNEMAVRIREQMRKMEDYVQKLEEVNRDLRHTRAELIYSEKRASVGQLAEGVAHEVGNPLSAVLGYLEILNKNIRGEMERDLIERSEREIGRINEIIRELLHYSRPAEADMGLVDAAETLRALVTLIGGQKRFLGVEIRQEAEKDLPQIIAGRNGLLQVLVNLAFNAADAMPEGGTLEIGAAQRPYAGPMSDNFVEAGYVTLQIQKGEPVVELWLRDTGTGMAPDVLARILDPFYTTKEPGKGTGLGLSISSRILEQFGARLLIESQPGKGTTCVITFPLPAAKE